VDPLAAEPTPKTKSKKIHLIYSGVSLAVIIIVGLVVYFWQQGLVKNSQEETRQLQEKVKSSEDKVKDLETQSGDLKTRIAFLEQALREATASSGQEVGNLTIVIKNTQRYDDPSNGNDNDLPVVINLEVKNNTNQALYYSKFAMKLKDAQNHSYSNPFDPPTVKYANMNDPNDNGTPTGFTPIPDQGVQPGETITGHVAFSGVPNSITSFTFFYGDMSFPITVK